MSKEETPQTAKQTFSLKRPTHSKKARPLLVDQFIEVARGHVICADLEMSFLKHMQEKYKDAEHNPYPSLAKDMDDQQAFYNYWLERLSFFKDLRDKTKAKDDAKQIAQEVAMVQQTSPEEIQTNRE